MSPTHRNCIGEGETLSSRHTGNRTARGDARPPGLGERLRDRETVPFKTATKGSKITKAFLLQLFVAYVLLVANSKVRDRETMVTIRNHLHCMGKDFVGGRPKGCYAMGKRVEAQSASRVGARQAGPSARRAGRGWTHVRTGPRNTAIGSGWRVTHATLLANAHHKNQTPRTGQAGMPCHSCSNAHSLSRA